MHESNNILKIIISPKVASPITTRFTTRLVEKVGVAARWIIVRIYLDIILI